MPDEENLSNTAPYNTTVKLMCTDNMIVEGSPVAKCSQTGEWEFENFQCKYHCFFNNNCQKKGLMDK